jgi:hypothetical protein
MSPSVLSPTYTNTDHASAEFTLSSSPGSVDIAPYETIICDQLIEALQTDSTLQAALQRAKDTLQRHAKWFTQPALTHLLGIALVRATETRSTADLYAALDFVDAVGTFSILPAGSLVPVARLIGYAYYQGTRMNKHRSLAEKAWTVLQHGLQSHLGQGGVTALLAVVRNGEHRHSKTGYAAASGVLRLIEEKLPLGEVVSTSLPSVSVFELLPNLKMAAENGDEMLKEQAWQIMHRILTEDSGLVELDKTASWDLCIDLLETSTLRADNDIANTLLHAVAKCTHRFEHRNIERLAFVFLKADYPLTETMADTLLAAQRSFTTTIGRRGGVAASYWPLGGVANDDKQSCRLRDNRAHNPTSRHQHHSILWTAITHCIFTASRHRRSKTKN